MFVITGGGSGIGRALACALADRQASVLIVGRQALPLIETARYSSYIDVLPADVSTPQGRQDVHDYLPSTIHGLIHNAGIIEPMAAMHEVNESEWHRLMATNVEAPLFLTQSLWSKLRQARVLNVGSGAAYFPVVGWSAYCVSKAALSMLTRCWQLEYPDRSFASVMPGIVDTDMQGLIRESAAMETDKLAFFHRLKRTQRLIEPETVASFLVWLLMDIDRALFSSKEWDIYDVSHHADWLSPSQNVPSFEEES